jgi:hypothetical protein
MIGYKLVPGKYPQKPNNTENEFFKNGWSIKKENNKFYMNYISGSLQGNLKSIEISKSDFNLAKDDKITFDELCIKYDVS